LLNWVSAGVEFAPAIRNAVQDRRESIALRFVLRASPGWPSVATRSAERSDASPGDTASPLEALTKTSLFSTVLNSISDVSRSAVFFVGVVSEFGSHMNAAVSKSDSPFPQGVALVIGGTGGFGEPICRQLAQQGSDVVFTYRSSEQRARSLEAEIRAAGVGCKAVALDVAQVDQIGGVFEGVVAEFGTIHSVIHAYGPLISLKYLSATSVEEMREMVLNETLPFFAIVKAALPHLRRSRGSLVAIHTVGLLRWPLKDGLSVVPKAGIAAIIQGIAREEGRNGVRANAVAPGVMDAGMFRTLKAKGEVNQRYVEATCELVPLQRLGEAEDVAEAAIFLASRRAKYITGQTLAVDGGFSV
jgi:NAD(P)-dependent dehydrogenase (short-subunit alcohol dehydrogenase family)